MATVVSHLFGDKGNKKNVNDTINDVLRRGMKVSQADFDAANEHLAKQGKPLLPTTAVVTTPKAITKEHVAQIKAASAALVPPATGIQHGIGDVTTKTETTTTTTTGAPPDGPATATV
jgi:hypothetical protein